MHLNGWLDTLINVGGDVAQSVFGSGGSAVPTYPVYTPPMFPTGTRPTPYSGGGIAPDYTPFLIGAAALVGVFLLSRRR